MGTWYPTHRITHTYTDGTPPISYCVEYTEAAADLAELSGLTQSGGRVFIEKLTDLEAAAAARASS